MYIQAFYSSTENSKMPDKKLVFLSGKFFIF